MTTPKYDLHTIDYSVQGWDAILAADMEKIDDLMPTRMIGTLGETVAAYEALYQEQLDGKWELALADGSKQPCLALAVEGGDEDDEIRLHLVGEITNEAWSWELGKPVYLDPDTPGALTQTRPIINAQIIGYAVSATTIYMFPQLLDIAVRGSSGGLVRKAVEEAVAITADSSVVIPLAIPSGARLLGVQFRVDEALAAGETWRAEYSGGADRLLVEDAAVEQNTKVNIMHDGVLDVTSDVTNITITKTGGGNFTAQGEIRVIVYYEEFIEMESVT